jgi:hypothetical protein
MKLKNQGGFTAVEALIILVVIAALGGGGYYVWHRNHNSSKSKGSLAQSSSIIQPQAYERTTTVPSGWKSYTNSAYKFSAAYPDDWHVSFNDTLNPATNTEIAKSATKLAELCYMPKDVSETCSFIFEILNQPLSESVSQAKSYYARAGFKSLGQTNLTIDNHTAVELRYQDELFPVVKDYYAYANGKTYHFPPVYETDGATNPLSAKDSLTVFESIKIK